MRLGEINNGEPVDVFMAPELAYPRRQSWRRSPLKQTGARIENFFELTDDRRRARVALPARGAHHLVDRCAFGSPQRLDHLSCFDGRFASAGGSGKFIYIQPGRPRIDDMLVGSVRKVSDYEFTFTIAGGYYGSQNWNIIHDRYFFSDVRSNECATLLNPPLARLQFGDGTGAIREASPARFGDQRARPRRPPPSRAFDEA